MPFEIFIIYKVRFFQFIYSTMLFVLLLGRWLISTLEENWTKYNVPPPPKKKNHPTDLQIFWRCSCTFDDKNIATTYDKSIRKLAIRRQHFNLWTTETNILGTLVYSNVFISYLGKKISEHTWLRNIHHIYCEKYTIFNLLFRMCFFN